MELFAASTRTEGKRIPTVMEYVQMLSDPSDADECKYNPCGAITEPQVDDVFAVESSAGFFRLLPGPEFCPRLYRGQSQFWEQCRPSMFRQHKRDIDRRFEYLKIVELMFTVSLHPASHDFWKWRVIGHEFAFDIEAIAQHYGYATSLLDFSRSKDIAMFFAVCEYDKKANRYRPKTNGIGVLYTADMKQLIHERGNQTSFLPLGLEPLPRPDAQRAFAIRMRANENLNEMQWVTCEKIELTSALSNHYYDMFEGGAVLFPRDGFDDHIQELRDSNKISSEVLDWAFANQKLPSHEDGIDGAFAEFVQAGYQINQTASCIPSGAIEAAAADWMIRREAYLRRIKVRPLCDHLAIRN